MNHRANCHAKHIRTLSNEISLFGFCTKVNLIFETCHYSARCEPMLYYSPMISHFATLSFFFFLVGSGCLLEDANRGLSPLDCETIEWKLNFAQLLIKFHFVNSKLLARNGIASDKGSLCFQPIFFPFSHWNRLLLWSKITFSTLLFASLQCLSSVLFPQQNQKA